MANKPTINVETKPYKVPNGVEIAGAWSWRLLALIGFIGVVIFIVIQLYVVVVPFLIAVLISALLVPLSNWLQRHGWPKWLSVIASLVGLAVIVTSLLALIVQQVRGSLPSLRTQALNSYVNFQSFMDTTYNVKLDSFDGLIHQGTVWLQGNTSYLRSGLESFGTTAGHVLTGLLLVLFTTIFILIDGRGIWKWIVSIFPKPSRRAIDGAGKSGWKTLTSFVRSQIIVALVDAIGIGLGALLLGLPLAIPIAVAVFLGAFIPLIGAILTGVLAIIIALIFNGPVAALIMLGVVLLVQQLESHVLQPFLIGKSVSIHPLAVVLAVAIGSLLAGIPGALFSVPFIAVVNSMVTYIAKKKYLDEPEGEVDPAVIKTA